MKSLYQEVALVDMNDDDLLTMIAFLWEEAKRTTEKMEADPHIQKVTEELAAYKKEHYTDAKKAYMSKLKAARYLAHARGLNYKLPGGSDEG